jgi:starch synthase
MNLIIDDNDQPLIIKVASIQAARMQVYFIDNEEYFQRKHIVHDKNGDFFEDNDERMLFFCKGVIETVKKLGWSPDVIHCHGWMTALLPVLIKKNYKDDPLFAESRVVYSLYNDSFDNKLNHRLPEKLIMDGIDPTDVELLKAPDYTSLTKHAIHFSDGVIVADEKYDNQALNFARKQRKPVLDFVESSGYSEAYSAFYDEVLLGDSVAELAES